MKKLLLALLVVMIALAGTAHAQDRDSMIADIIDKIPVTNTGAYYSLDNNRWEFVTTFRAAEYEGFDLNIGYASPDSCILMLGYQLTELENLGVKVPILKDLVVDAGYLIGWREPTEEQEFTQGPAVTLGIKF